MQSVLVILKSTIVLKNKSVYVKDATCLDARIYSGFTPCFKQVRASGCLLLEN